MILFFSHCLFHPFHSRVHLVSRVCLWSLKAGSPFISSGLRNLLLCTKHHTIATPTKNKIRGTIGRARGREAKFTNHKAGGYQHDVIDYIPSPDRRGSRRPQCRRSLLPHAATGCRPADTLRGHQRPNFILDRQECRHPCQVYQLQSVSPSISPHNLLTQLINMTPQQHRLP